MKIAPRRPLILFAGAAMLGATVIVLLQPDETGADLTPRAAAAAPTAPMPAPPPAAPVPVKAATTAGLQLKGVLGFSGGHGAAIFALPDGRQRRVAVGGEVVPGARLVSIGIDRAVINDGVQHLELALPELRSGDGVPAGAAPTPAPIQTPVAVAPSVTREAGDFQIGLQPEGAAGQPRGYRFTGSTRLPALEAAGLQPGDLIVAVNGQPLDASRLAQMPAEIEESASVTIDIVRDGRRITTAVPKN